MRGSRIGIQPDGRPLRAGGPDPYGLRDALRRHFENLELIMSCWLRALTQRTFREPGTDFTGRHQLPRKINQVYGQRLHRRFFRLPGGHKRGCSVVSIHGCAQPRFPADQLSVQRTAPALGRGFRQRVNSVAGS